jgi:2-keto-4-pentenoate hydratase
MNQREIAAAVEDFIARRRRGEYFPRAWQNRLTQDDAYRILLGWIDRCASQSGKRRIGWKVGLTAPAIQSQFGVHEPVFGCLIEEGKLRSGDVLGPDLINPGFENEICVLLERDVAPMADAAAVTRAIAAVFPAIEIIETRGDFTRDLAQALADNAQQKAFVLGSPVPPAAIDLAAVTVRVLRNGVEIGSGRGDAVLGHPFNAVAWLARKLAQFGEVLGAGDFVMTGSLTRQFPLSRGDRVEAVFDGLGAVSVALS